MISCPNCSTQNRVGILFCEECGYNLTGVNTAIATRQISEQSANEGAAAKATWGSARFGRGATVLLHVRNVDEPIRVEPANRMIIGRYDGSSNKPDVDLAPFGAAEKGVSRQHAMVELSEDTLTLLDLGSSNGTYLNGQRLVKDQPRVLRDGDEIRLGKLVAHIYFK